MSYATGNIFYTFRIGFLDLGVLKRGGKDVKCISQGCFFNIRLASFKFGKHKRNNGIKSTSWRVAAPRKQKL